MNWEAVGALAESLGAAGVILTLLYLAGQIRRSNVLATAESRRFRLEIAAPSILAIAQDPELAKLFLEGLANRDSMPPHQRLQFDLLFGQLISSLVVPITDEALLDHRGPPQTLGNRENIRLFLSAPGGASWWGDHGSRISPTDRAAIEEIMRSQEPAA